MPHKKTQEILVPKGTIDPNEDTIIEVPLGLKQQTLVVQRISKKPPPKDVDSTKLFDLYRSETVEENTAGTSSKPSDFLSSTWQQPAAASTPARKFSRNEDFELSQIKREIFFEPQEDDACPCASQSQFDRDSRTSFSREQRTEEVQTDFSFFSKSTSCQREPTDYVSPVSPSGCRQDKFDYVTAIPQNVSLSMCTSCHNKSNVASLSTVDDIYIEQLKRQFLDAKRKLQEALLLASKSMMGEKGGCSPKCPLGATSSESMKKPPSSRCAKSVNKEERRITREPKELPPEPDTLGFSRSSKSCVCVKRSSNESKSSTSSNKRPSRCKNNRSNDTFQ